MSKSGEFYNCIPNLNKECKKDNCYLSGGPCHQTVNIEYSLDSLLKDYQLTKKEWNDLFEENVKMWQEIKGLRTYKRRIIRAIEFIKKYGTEAKCEVNRYGKHCICASDFNEGAIPLLKILQGDDNGD